jgi:glycosyltransferase involved in cell wall biosynthesis
MFTSPHSLGVVIRTLNESALLGRCIDTLKAQATGLPLDILVVDSGSTDETVAIAREHGARVIEIPPEDFDYSRALNLGIREVRGDLIALLSAHAVPVDGQWIARMTAPFADEFVAGVSSGQVPWPDAPWWEVLRIGRAFPTARIEYRDPAASIVFSNAASCIRRAVWEAHQFTLPAAEDVDWARRVVAEGWSVVYDPRATVFHSHDEDPRAQARRMIDVNRVSEGIRRSRARTAKEALGLMYYNGRSILALKEPIGRRAAYLADLAKMCWYYVIDFARPGSTAERRREDETVLRPA